MNVKLIQGMVGDNYSFLPRQIISCPDAVGKELIQGRVAVKASDDAEVDAEFPELSDEEKDSIEAAAVKKYKGMGLDHARVMTRRLNLRRQANERTKAILPRGGKTPSTPEDSGGPAPVGDGKCQGETGAGNPCGRKAAKGSEFCAAHEPKN